VSGNHWPPMFVKQMRLLAGLGVKNPRRVVHPGRGHKVIVTRTELSRHHLCSVAMQRAKTRSRHHVPNFRRFVKRTGQDKVAFREVVAHGEHNVLMSGQHLILLPAVHRPDATSPVVAARQTLRPALVETNVGQGQDVRVHGFEQVELTLVRLVDLQLDLFQDHHERWDRVLTEQRFVASQLVGQGFDIGSES
jgi:hypothetical protein